MTFPLFFDEHEDVRLAARLIKGGLDVLTTQEAGRDNKRLPDEDQLAFATGEGRTIVTHNVSDFYALYKAWWAEERDHAGIIVVSPRKLQWEIYAAIMHYQELYPEGIPNLILPI